MSFDNPNKSAAADVTRSLAKILGDRKLRLSIEGDTIQLAGSAAPTPEQEWQVQQLNIALTEAVQLAVNAACIRIQAEIGVDTGDHAGMHFATDGPQELRIRGSLATYLIDAVESAIRESNSEDEDSA